ncbi:MAG: DNA cytosine methyltransferase [Candidatus Helarchaeota archaeon]|nr:DNA cytosine methyltransferase [Candidatus Helarchaeota archaeon]
MEKQDAVIDLFSGCGGFSQGFQKAGFNVIAASEIWVDAIRTYRENHPSTKIIEGDISEDCKKRQLYEYLNGIEIDVIIGGPPCQGYSLAGNRDPEDPRGRLYLDFVEIINEIRPKIFVMENVKGLMSMKHVKPDISLTELSKFKENCRKNKRFKDLKRFKAQRKLNLEEMKEYNDLKHEKSQIHKQMNKNLIPLLQQIIDRIKKIGYQVEPKVLNAANYGVPQTRERIFLIGTRIKELTITFPSESHMKDPSTTSNGGDQKETWVPVKAILKKYEQMEENEELSHIFTNHSQKFKEKVRRTPPGKNVYPQYSDAFWKLDPNRPARTVKENHGGVHMHYSKDRACTPRELAALQTFDDKFIFKGSKSSILKQIGNAVPPLLAKKIADHIIFLFKEYGF